MTENDFAEKRSGEDRRNADRRKISILKGKDRRVGDRREEGDSRDSDDRRKKQD